LFSEREEVSAPPAGDPDAATFDRPWTAAIEPEAYARSVAAVRDWIASGDTYQVNLTFPLRSVTGADPEALYATLGHAQRAGYCALLRLPGWSILSISPELFFRWEGDVLEMRPMKGTRPRGRWSEEDQALARALHASEKDRAE